MPEQSWALLGFTDSTPGEPVTDNTFQYQTLQADYERLEGENARQKEQIETLQEQLRECKARLLAAPKGG